VRHDPLFGKDARRIFDLLIYRCTEGQYFEERQIECEKFLRNLGCDPSSTEPSVLHIKEIWSRKHGGAWIVNEIVGLIAIFASRHQIGGDLYFVKRRVSKHMLRKRLFLLCTLFRLNIWPSDSSEAIYRTLRDLIDARTAEMHSLRRRVIDFEPLETLGPHIDWAGLTHARL
jgi:hypothetical protein